MKQGIHPEYVMTATVHCSCGDTFETRSTKPELRVEICSQCHPFYTGKQKLVDTGGRVERFQRRYAKKSDAESAPATPEDGQRRRRNCPPLLWRPGRHRGRHDARPRHLGRSPFASRTIDPHRVARYRLRRPAASDPSQAGLPG